MLGAPITITTALSRRSTQLTVPSSAHQRVRSIVCSNEPIIMSSTACSSAAWASRASTSVSHSNRAMPIARRALVSPSCASVITRSPPHPAARVRGDESG